MNTNLEFIRKAANDMYLDKIDNMYECDISEEVYDFLKDKKEQVINAVCELIKNNGIVNKNFNIKALDGYTYDLIGDWELYEEFEDIDELNYEVIEHCTTETMDEISNDALYNYDALWLTAIHKAFPNDTTDTQCGCGMMQRTGYRINHE